LTKAIYEFGRGAFREELMESYLLPVAEWLLGEDSTPYLLPQHSGSNWECALAIQFLLNLDASAAVDSEMRYRIQSKCVQTARWMIGQATDEGPGKCSWDGVSWDTAVCSRVLLSVQSRFSTQFAEEEKKVAEERLRSSVRWLVEKSLNWNRDVRYSGGPPDLGQVLLTLTVIAETEPDLLRAAERAEGIEDGRCIIDHVARVVLAMEERTTVEAQDGPISLSFWVDCFNSSEVVEGISAYLAYCASPHRWGSESYEAECKKIIRQCVRYIEVNQSGDGTWGGVADTCGTLLGYLRVTSSIVGVDPENHVVFKAVRWMCDEKQSMRDGSFLHTSYVTVFYALALWECYEGWALALKSTTEVYDIALWGSPFQSTAERSRRLELELQLEDVEVTLERFQDSRNTWLTFLVGAATFIGVLLLELLVLNWAGALTVTLGISVKNPGQFWTVAAVGVSVAIAVPGGATALRRRRPR
jgi:hypothetical protein